MQTVHDVAILGGGPAGMACALRAADQGASVLLCDPQSGSFDKPCGEGILPAGVQVLRELGVSAPGKVRPFAGIRYCVPGAGQVSMDFVAPGEAWWRPDLHAALSSALAQRSQILQRSRRATVTMLDEHFRISAGNEIHKARFLVAADGAGGQTAAWLRPESRRLTRQRVGVRARFEEASKLDRVEIHFGGGYDVYLTPLARGAINVVVLAEVGSGSLPDASSLLHAGLSKHPAARACLGGQISRAESRILGLPWPRLLSDGRSFLIGDAGGAVDPILGAGMTVALRTGAQAADAVLAIQQGMPNGQAAAAFQRAGRSERRARRVLVAGLRLASRHDFLARQLARSLRLAPGVARRLTNIAAGQVGVSLDSLPVGT